MRVVKITNRDEKKLMQPLENKKEYEANNYKN